MGLQDRDYYREKYNKLNQEALLRQSSNQPYSSGQPHHCLPRRGGKSSSGIKYLLYPLFVLLALWYGANGLLDRIKHGRPSIPRSTSNQQPFANRMPVDLIPGGIILQTDRNGHFRGTALINNVPMPFMIDTGATQTTIPANLAIAAGLPFGRSIQTTTAGGQVVDQQTKINSLKIGNAEIRNLDASINRHLNEVLIGMNTLKYFRMTLNGNTLTLVAYSRPEEIAEIERGLTIVPPPMQIVEKNNYRAPMETAASDQPDIKAKTTWKKSVVCDAQKNCKTIYGE